MNTKDTYYVVGFIYYGSQRIDLSMMLESNENHKVTIGTLDRWRNRMIEFVKESKDENPRSWLGSAKEDPEVVISFFHKLDNED